MPRTSSQIQAEIDILETFLVSAQSLMASVGSDGTTVSRDRANAQKRLDSLYTQLGRANGTSPMLLRGRLLGLR